MAGSYSRELSVKVTAGKFRIAGLGYRVGGMAGYGLGRQLLQDGRTHGQLLEHGQRKSLLTDRVTVVPGPREEVDVIHRIYREPGNAAGGALVSDRPLDSTRLPNRSSIRPEPTTPGDNGAVTATHPTWRRSASP